ncbi:MAG: hypothetical protein JJU28_07440 [Cyclobacteriaceae bacterium]|nr:hypothetical protein [Cyclobacteriaceae bacterium]
MLPYRMYQGTTLVFTIDVLIRIGQIELFHMPSLHSQGSGADVLFPGARLRYIIIPGGVPVNGKVAIPVDFNDYDAVCDYFGIEK